MKKVNALTIIGLVILLSGCWGSDSVSPVIFSKVKPENRFDNKGLAVVPGFAGPENEELGKQLILMLSDDKRLNVIPYAQIMKSITTPNLSILGDDFPSPKERFSNWLSDNNRLRLNELNRSIGAGYLLVFWTDKWRVVRGAGSEKIMVNVFTRLIRYPDNAVAAYSYFGFETGVVKKIGTERFDETKKYMYGEIAKEISTKIKAEW